MLQIKTCVLILFLSAIACKNNPATERSVAVPTEGKTESVDTISESGIIGHESKTETDFDKVKWTAKDDHHYIYRNEMLTEIMNNHILDGLKKDEILDLLGEPDRSDGDFLFYQIAQKRLGFWPLHTKTLVIKFDEYAIEWIRIHE